MNYFWLQECTNHKEKNSLEEHLVVWRSGWKWACWISARQYLQTLRKIFTYLNQKLANLISIYTNLNQKFANLTSTYTNLNQKIANLMLIFANLMKSEQTLRNTCKLNTLFVEIKWSLFYLFSMSSFLIQLLHCRESHVCFHMCKFFM